MATRGFMGIPKDMLFEIMHDKPGIDESLDKYGLDTVAIENVMPGFSQKDLVVYAFARRHAQRLADDD
eukprot:11177513-Lingulodinium_polyedra.AAC.1